jgi:hypothetical protein
MTDVMDLATGNIYTYDVEPKKALILCFEHITKDNYNTLDYDLNKPIVETDLCYSIGDIAVFKDGRSIK